MHKVINPLGKVHNFRERYENHQLNWTRMWDKYKFENAETTKYTGFIFSEVPILLGDFILTLVKPKGSTESIQVVCEVILIRDLTNVAPCLYEGDYLLCGKYKDGKIDFLEGYGVYKEREFLQPPKRVDEREIDWLSCLFWWIIIPISCLAWLIGGYNNLYKSFWDLLYHDFTMIKRKKR